MFTQPGEVVIETIVATLAVKGGGRLIRAAVENRSLGSQDVGEVASAFLEALVAGQRKADADLARIEQKLDKLETDPYHAAMTSGTLLLADAAAGHRRPEDRQQMLDDGRQAFADAVGHARGRPIDLARAQVMYGMTWAALGSGDDLSLALNRATRALQAEVLTAFQLNCKWNREQQARATAPATRFPEAILGPSQTSPDWTASNRFSLAQKEHEAVWRLRVEAVGKSGSFPQLPLPHRSAYSHFRPGLPVRAWMGEQFLLDTVVSLGPSGLHVDNRGDSMVRAELVTPVLNAERVISPDVSPLDRGGTVIRPGTKARLPHSGPGSPAACLILGQAEQADLAVLLHKESVWPSRGLLGP